MPYEAELADLDAMQQVYSTLFALTNKLQVLGDQAMGVVTARQFMTMLAVLHLPEDGASLIRIASKLGTTKQNASTMVSALARRGFVEVASSCQDKRAVNVTVTKAGMVALVQANDQGVLFLESVFHGFTSGQLGVLRQLLAAMYRFDGADLDGFEDQAVPSGTDDWTPQQLAIVEEFARRRQQSGKD